MFKLCSKLAVKDCVVAKAATPYKMDVIMPPDYAQHWDIMLILMSSEENETDNTSETEIETMNSFLQKEATGRLLAQWIQDMQRTHGMNVQIWDTPLKCDDVSYRWRQKGNDSFSKASYAESYKCYTRSVMYAQEGGPMYPLALANRSAASLKLHRFKESIADVQLAIAHGYPPDQRHKLLMRCADCYYELNQVTKANGAVQEAIEIASALNLAPALANEFERNVRSMKLKLRLLVDEDEHDEDIRPECFLGLNEEFASASNALTLCRSDTAGRQVRLKHETQRGDIMFTEEPYAWVVIPNEDEPVCDGCCRAEINPIPCSTCSRTGYCDEACRDRAFESHHKWECPGISADVFSTIGIAHLALRVLLVGALNGFPEVPQEVPAPTTAAELFAAYSAVDDIEIYKATTAPFFRMFKLVTNLDKMSNTEYIQYALTATMLIHYLEDFTSFFEYLPSRVPYALTPEELRLFAGALILRSMGQLVCNGHATLSLCFYEDGNREYRTVNEREVRRATAVFPSASMMNHSCDPNIINTFYKNRLIVRCSRELAVGDELFNCYGPHRTRATTQQRREQLRAQYMFDCECDACADVGRVEFVLLFSAYLCQICKGPVVKTSARPHCPQCQVDIHLQTALAILDRSDELAAQARMATNLEERCERAQASFRLKQQVLHKHHTALRAAADQLAQHYADLGDFPRSIELIKQNIQSAEYQYGSFSVEVGHELRKLSEVMMQRIMRFHPNPQSGEWCIEAHKICKKAIQLMELNYGTWEPMAKRLHEQEAFIAAMIAESLSQDFSARSHNRI